MDPKGRTPSLDAPRTSLMALCLRTPHRCCSFHQLKARPPTSKELAVSRGLDERRDSSEAAGHCLLARVPAVLNCKEHKCLADLRESCSENTGQQGLNSANVSVVFSDPM